MSVMSALNPPLLLPVGVPAAIIITWADEAPYSVQGTMGKTGTGNWGRKLQGKTSCESRGGVCTCGLARRSLGAPGGRPGQGRAGYLLTGCVYPWTTHSQGASPCSQPNAVSYLTCDRHTVTKRRNAATGNGGAPWMAGLAVMNFSQFSTKDTEYQSHASFHFRSSTSGPQACNP